MSEHQSVPDFLSRLISSGLDDGIKKDIALSEETLYKLGAVRDAEPDSIVKLRVVNSSHMGKVAKRGDYARLCSVGSNGCCVEIGGKPSCYCK